jgi:hypothetical protein
VTAVLVAIAAVLVVLGTSILKNVDWSDKVKNTVAVALSVVAGVASVWATGGFVDVTDVLEVATLVYGVAQAIYIFMFKGTGFNDILSNWSIGGKEELPVDGPPLEEG